MKTILTLSLLATLFTGCDAPQRTRLMDNALSSNNLTQPGNLNPGNTTNPPTTTGSSTGGGTSLPSGFSNCDITPKHYYAGLGTIGICQSSLSETSVLFKSNQDDKSSRTCLIPTYKDQSGSSAYIGQPQCLYTTENALVQGVLYKNRSGYTSYPLNGVMIMKESSLAPYYACMDAYVKYVSQACPYGAQTNATCDQYARNYMTQLCNTFKTTYSYLDIRLKP
jgi:hypothetical protein